MNFHWTVVLFSPVTWLIAFAAAITLLRRSKTKQEQSDGRRRPRVRVGAAALGAAFQFLAVAYRPSHAFLAKAQIQQQEDAQEDDDGTPETSLQHLHRQLRRIRRGEPIDRLIWRLE